MYTFNLLFPVIDISNNSFQTLLPNIRLDSNDKFKGVVHQNNNIYASKSSADMSKQSMLQTPPSLLNVRTPLSNISIANSFILPFDFIIYIIILLLLFYHI
uniref:Uncharacterized protein n=1 Tax=Lactuca sativa TaxID=4236 RepID=A0A9R1X2W7_LACSA|nr:hypothetical protein LSAT_V11C700379800 [Lactuca sativa]